MKEKGSLELKHLKDILLNIFTRERLLLEMHGFRGPAIAVADVNGDGFADLITGAWRYDRIEGTQTFFDVGAGFIIYGGPERLKELDAVQAFHSAQPQHGGTGAVYVLLRKNAEQKRANRLQYLKGRVQD